MQNNFLLTADYNFCWTGITKNVRLWDKRASSSFLPEPFLYPWGHPLRKCWLPVFLLPFLSPILLNPLKTLVLRHSPTGKMGRGRGKWKTGQQLCRKVCNSIKGSCKCPVYKGFRDWFHGLFGHETRGGEKGEFDGSGEGKREGRERERGRFWMGFWLGWQSDGQKI